MSNISMVASSSNFFISFELKPDVGSIDFTTYLEKDIYTILVPYNFWTKSDNFGHSECLYASEYDTPRHPSDADACFVYISAYFFSHNELMRFEFASVF